MLFQIRNYELVKDREKTFLTVASTVGATTLTVKAIDSNAWSDNDWVIVGEIGSKNAEILQLNGAVSDGTSLTIDNAGSGGARFAHSINEPIYRIDYNQVEISRATTGTGSKTVLTTNELQVDDEFTRYEDTANSTGYGFVRFYNSQSTAYSDYSDAIPYTGYTAKSLGRIIKLIRRRLGIEGQSVGDLRFIDDEDILEEINEKQRDVCHERLWSFLEKTYSASRVAYQRLYSISSSAQNSKVYSIRVDSQPLAKIDKQRAENLNFDSNTTGEPSHGYVWENKIGLYPLPTSAATSTTLDSAISSTTATTISLTSTSGFRAPGRCIIDSEVISYEAIDSDNNDLLGCVRGDEGTTAATHSNGATVTERDIIYTAHGEPDDLTDYTDETIVPDPNVIVNGTASELAIGKLQDQVLHDRLKVKYDEGMKKLRDKFGRKFTGAFYRIKDKDEVFRDTGRTENPNNFPTDIG